MQVQAPTRGLTGMVATRRSKTGTVAAAVTVAPAAAVTVTVPAATAAATVHAHSHLIQLADLSSSDDDEDLFDEPAPQQPVRGRGRGRGRGSKRGAGRQPAARPRKRAKTPAPKAPKLSEREKVEATWTNVAAVIEQGKRVTTMLPYVLAVDPRPAKPPKAPHVVKISYPEPSSRPTTAGSTRCRSSPRWTTSTC